MIIRTTRYQRLAASLLLIALPTLSPALQAAPPPQDDWTNLQRIHPGEEVHVVRSDKKSADGRFVSASAEAITLDISGGALTVPRSEVVRVTKRRPSHRMRNTLIGLGIGAAVGLVLDQTLGAIARNEGGINSDRIIALNWIVPLSAGAGIGAATGGGEETVYRVSALPVTVAESAPSANPNPGAHQDSNRLLLPYPGNGRGTGLSRVEAIHHDSRPLPSGIGMLQLGADGTLLAGH